MSAATVPTGFVDELMISGLNNPTQVEFSSDGRVFVAEKSGLIRVYDYLGDPTPEVFADLRTEVHNFWDRGLLGLELAPGFPDPPYVYALYTRDARDRRIGAAMGHGGRDLRRMPHAAGCD